jgi:hypothetical protein
MKSFYLFVITVFLNICLSAQIINPQIKASFGVDAELISNLLGIAPFAGTDDWFSNGGIGAGKSVIDTSGAAAILLGYVSNPATRNRPLVRNMSYPAFTVVDNRLLVDAVFVRDFHGDDSTTFAAGSNKNGQSPAVWSSPPSQSIPDKNEILDAFMHVRRDGATPADSLWMFGAISIENTTGNRYFDFEMFQTDIYFDKTTRKFNGYGPDASHTSWKFDALGNVTQPGDIIFTAEYSSSALSVIEARIWIDRIELANSPALFDWEGNFDGAKSISQFGYASIVPKDNGIFYCGLQSANNTWGGPFGIVLGNNTLQTNYIANQFMEFAVNLTKLGLDPVTILGGSTCDRPFQKVLVKSRSSTSFTAELKDFIAPFYFGVPGKVNLFTEVPIFCGVYSVSNIKVTNPIAGSKYTWTTTNGHFADSSISTSVFVDAPGTYIVAQKLNSDCPVFARDTITILFDSTCGVLYTTQLKFSCKKLGEIVQLSWQKTSGNLIKHYEVERSTDGFKFQQTQKIYPENNSNAIQYLNTTDDITCFKSQFIYYRLKITDANKKVSYSQIIKLAIEENFNDVKISLMPNPAKNFIKLNIRYHANKNIAIHIYDCFGNLVFNKITPITKGDNSIIVNNLPESQSDIFIVKIFLEKEVYIQKVLHTR